MFETRRPLHPARLHEALEELTSDALRGRGQLWIASQPDAVIGWESAGGAVALSCLGSWLAALPVDRWGETSDLRRLAADLGWDAYYGDRRTVLAFIGIGLRRSQTWAGKPSNRAAAASSITTGSPALAGPDAVTGAPRPVRVGRCGVSAAANSPAAIAGSPPGICEPSHVPACHSGHGACFTRTDPGAAGPD